MIATKPVPRGILALYALVLALGLGVGLGLGLSLWRTDRGDPTVSPGQPSRASAPAAPAATRVKLSGAHSPAAARVVSPEIDARYEPHPIEGHEGATAAARSLALARDVLAARDAPRIRLLLGWHAEAPDSVRLSSADLEALRVALTCLETAPGASSDLANAFLRNTRASTLRKHVRRLCLAPAPT